MAKDLLAALLVLPRTPLLTTEFPAGAGLYLHWIGSTRPDMIERLGVAAQGEVPAYCGSTGTGLRARQGRHKLNLAGLPGLDLNEIWVSTLPCSGASALFGEAVVLDRLRPPLNSLGGWGSMTPGRRRAGQIASPVDAFWAPGRSWARPPSLRDQVRARCQVIAALARIDPAGPRWPKLVMEPTEPSRGALPRS